MFGVEGHQGPALPRLEPHALIALPGLDLQARDARRAKAAALPGLAEVGVPGPQVSHVRRQRRWIGQPPGRLRIALAGQALQVRPQRLAVVLPPGEFELFAAVGDQAADLPGIKFPRLFDAVVTCSAISAVFKRRSSFCRSTAS